MIWTGRDRVRRSTFEPLRARLEGQARGAFRELQCVLLLGAPAGAMLPRKPPVLACRHPGRRL